MIQPLRTGHRRAMFALAAALPVLFVAGLVARKSPAPANQAVRWEGGAGAQVQWRQATPFRLGSTEATIRESADGTWLEIQPGADPLTPDLLVYWSATAPSRDALPPDSHLLGTLAGRRAQRMQLPGSAQQTHGYVMVYSLAHQSLAGSVRLRGLP
jgi:hypothetical protein